MGESPNDLGTIARIPREHLGAVARWYNQLVHVTGVTANGGACSQISPGPKLTPGGEQTRTNSCKLDLSTGLFPMESLISASRLYDRGLAEERRLV